MLKSLITTLVAVPVIMTCAAVGAAGMIAVINACADSSAKNTKEDKK